MRALILALALAACSQQAPPSTGDADTPTAAQTPATEATAVDNLAQMPQWGEARAAGVDFRAVGQEPGWLLDVYTAGSIKFVWDYGENYAEFSGVTPTYPQEGATRYEASSDGVSLVVTIRRFPCQDAMSGEAFPSTVEVVVDGRALNGCGRSV
ncbi:MAG: hypothetical protein K2P70_02885 [Hyphomonadaceae bacterium]|nr:hypothetical protein [Hyphomonadaceae bacterium]